ncbi:MAG: cation:proton antiporter [Candidatus Dormibacteria bacterium]
MAHAGFGNLLIVTAVAFGAPFLLGLLPQIRIPAVVVEIVLGIAVGPAVLGLVHVDLPIQILSTIGLAFLLFLAGMEVDPTALSVAVLRLTGAAFLLSLGLAVAIGFASFGLGLVKSPLLIAIILLATSLGLVAPVLKDAGEETTPLGQLVIAAASVADFGAVILLSLFFSRESTSPATRLILLSGFATLAALVVLGASRLSRVMRVSALLVRLQDTTAEIRVRAAVLLLIAFVSLAQRIGLETILAAFLAGAAVRLIDRDQARMHQNFHLKLEAIGYGFLIPVFFITSGLQFDLHALVSSPSGLIRLPLFLLGLLIVRALPALLYRRSLGGRRAAAAGLLQATSLPFIVAATAIGMELGLITTASGAALVGAGLTSVVLFPLAAVMLLRRGGISGPAARVLQSANRRKEGTT